MVDEDEDIERNDEAPGHDFLAPFRSWAGFLVAALVVNALFVYGMLGPTHDPKLGIWYKSLIWLPFDAIATALYFVFAMRFGKSVLGRIAAVLCFALIVANWVVMWRA